MRKKLCLVMASVMILLLISCSQDSEVLEPSDTENHGVEQTQEPEQGRESPSPQTPDVVIPTTTMPSQEIAPCDFSSLINGGLDLKFSSKLISLFTGCYPQLPSRFKLENINLESNTHNPVRILFECDLSKLPGDPDCSGYFDALYQAYFELQNSFFTINIRSLQVHLQDDKTDITLTLDFPYRLFITEKDDIYYEAVFHVAGTDEKPGRYIAGDTNDQYLSKAQAVARLKACADTQGLLYHGYQYHEKRYFYRLIVKGRDSKKEYLVDARNGCVYGWSEDTGVYLKVYQEDLPWSEHDVHNMEELQRALGPNRTIRLHPGNYDINHAFSENTFGDGRWSKYSDGNLTVNHKDPNEIMITGLSHLKLVGMPEQGKDYVDFITDEIYSPVLSFHGCSYITIQNLNLGHDPKAQGCTGDVLILESCEAVSIDHCVLFGSGLNGLVARNCRDVTFANSNIVDCSEYMMKLAHCDGFDFERAGFLKRAYGIEYAACQDITFKDCTMLDEPDALINFGSISMVADYINSRPPADESTGMVSTGNLDIRINWLKGYQDYGPRTGKIEVVRSDIEEEQVSYHLETKVGRFVLLNNNTLEDLGTSYDCTDMDGLYLTESPNQRFYHNETGLFKVSAYAGEKLEGTHTQKVYYNHTAKAYYTLMENGIPAIPSPLENQYAFFSIMKLDDMSLDALISRFGERYAIEEYYRETLYVYDFGLTLSKGENGTVSKIYLGDFGFSPLTNLVKEGDLLEEEGLETATLYECGLYYGLYIENQAQGSYLNTTLDYLWIDDWELMDLTGDSRSEIYISGSGDGVMLRKLYAVENGKMSELFSPLDEMEQISRVSCSLEGKQLTVSIDDQDKGRQGSCTLPDRLFPEGGELNDNHALSLASQWEPTERDGQRLIKVICTIQKKVGEYYYGPPATEIQPEDMSDLNVDVAWATFYLKHDGVGWQTIDTDLTMKLCEGSGRDAPPITFDQASIGVIALDITVREAVLDLGGNPDDYTQEELEWGGITIDGVYLGGFYSMLHQIVLSSSQYATERGLRVGDSIETLEGYYGKPDVGRYEDGLVSWYFTSGGEPVFSRQMAVTLEDDLVKAIEFYQYCSD